MGERAPAGVEQLLGGFGVAKDSTLFLLEDAVTRQGAKQPMERVRLGADLLSQILDAPRPVGQRLRNAEIGDDRQGSRDERSAQRVPQLRLRRACAHPRAVPTADATSSASESVSVRQSRSSRPSRMTPITGGSPARNGAGKLFLDRAGEARQLRQRKRAAADPRDGLLDLSADELGQPLGTRPHGVGRLGRHAQDRDLAERALRIEVERERALERGQGQLVRTDGALERMAAQPLDELRAADDDPGLRAAEELVAREADEVGAGLEALPHRRLLT